MFFSKFSRYSGYILQWCGHIYNILHGVKFLENYVNKDYCNRFIFDWVSLFKRSKWDRIMKHDVANRNYIVYLPTTVLDLINFCWGVESRRSGGRKFSSGAQEQTPSTELGTKSPEAKAFLANVNSRSRSLYAITRPSVCRLSVVCRLWRSCALLRQLILFGNISAALGTLAIHWHPPKILRRSSQGNPSAGEVEHKRGSKI